VGDSVNGVDRTDHDDDPTALEEFRATSEPESRADDLDLSEHEVPRLEEASVLGFLGDTHGTLDHVRYSLARLAKRQARVVIQLGDFGFIWPGDDIDRQLSTIGQVLADADQVLLFVDGNHEWFPRLHEYMVREDGIRWISPRIGHLPRGYRTTLSNGMVLGALGGAGSIDMADRVEGVSCWREETITEADVEALGHDPVDILVGHEAPFGMRSLTDAGPATWGLRGWLHAMESRYRYTQAFWNVRPRLSMSGHWHRFVSDLVVTSALDAQPGDSAASFRTRSIVLDMDGPGRYSLATLDLESLDINVLTRHGQEADSSTDWKSIPERST